MGIIGFGNMGKAHTNKITSGMVPNMEICALCDIDEKKRDLIKEMYPDIPVFADAEEMFKSGLNVLTEKPAGVYTKQVKEMNEAAAKSDKVFGIMYNQRTNPLYQKLKNLIEDGELGGIKRITWIITDWYRTQAYHDSSAWRSNWKLEGGGALINQAVHSLDLLRYLADDFVSVRANMMNYSLEDAENTMYTMYSMYDSAKNGGKEIDI